MGDIGLEHSSPTPSKTPILEGGGAKSDAHDAPQSPKPPQDPDLASVVNAWPKLPWHIRIAIRSLVKADLQKE